jgi:hypothetical protein
MPRAAILDEGSMDAFEKHRRKERSTTIVAALPYLEGQMVRISISHDGEYATATAIASYDEEDSDEVKSLYSSFRKMMSFGHVHQSWAHKPDRTLSQDKMVISRT